MLDNEIAPGVYREVDHDAGVVLYFVETDGDVQVKAVKVDDERLKRISESGH